MAKQTHELMKTYLEIEVRDKDGKLISKRRQRSDSWLKQIMQILKGEFATRYDTDVGHANATVYDETATGRTYPAHSSGSTVARHTNLSTLGDSGDATQGIIIGSGDQPNSLVTYCLQSKIEHGSASGQMLYGAETVEEVTNPSGMDLEFRIIRAFTNNSGASITVKEIGLLVKKIDSTFTARSFLILRDVLPSPSVVPDLATMTVRYIIKMTVA